MAYTNARDSQQVLEEQNTTVSGYSASSMPDAITLVDRATGLVTWKPDSTVAERHGMLSQEDADRFSADLDALIAEFRPKEKIRFSMLTSQQEHNTSRSQPDVGPCNMGAFLPMHAVSTVPTYMADPCLYTPEVTSNDYYSPHSNIIWKADGIPQIPELSRSAGKLPLPGSPPGNRSKLVSASQSKTGKTYKLTPSKPTVKHLKPNQIYGRIVKDYVDHPAKMAQLEQFLQSLPTDKCSLSRTSYANASPYEQLFIYQRLTRSEYRHRQSHSEVQRKYLSMRLQLQVEVNPSLLKALFDAGVPLSKKNAASLKLWTEQNQARKEIRVARKASTKAAHNGEESKDAPVQHQSSGDNASIASMAVIENRPKSGQSTSMTPNEHSPPTSPDIQSEGDRSDLKLSLGASAIEFVSRLLLAHEAAEDGAVATTEPRKEDQVRPGSLVRQLRRPTMDARRAKAPLAEKTRPDLGSMERNTGDGEVLGYLSGRGSVIVTSSKTSSPSFDEDGASSLADQGITGFLQYDRQVDGVDVQMIDAPANAKERAENDRTAHAPEMPLDSSMAGEV